MRKIAWGAAALVLVALILVVATRVAPRWRSRSGAVPAATESAGPMALLDDQEAPPEPHISLQIDAVGELETVQGTPLVFSVGLSNPRAANAASTNRVREANLTLIEGRLRSGELSAASAEPLLALARRRQGVRAVQLGGADLGWHTFLRFERQAPGAEAGPLPWTLNVVAEPAAQAVTLDADSTLAIDYALSPQASARVAPGQYSIVAVLDVPDTAPLARGQWRGRVTSGVVKLTITPRSAQLSATNQKTADMQSAEFFATTGDWRQALAFAERVVAADPSAIPAHIIIAQAKEGLGDAAGALTAYGEARRLFEEQRPDSYEAPRYLDANIDRLSEQLHILR